MADPNTEFLRQRFGGAPAADPNAAFLQSMFGGAPQITPPQPKKAQDIGDAVLAGLQNSATGLALRGKLPSQQLGEDAPWYQRIASGGAGLVADLPLSIAAAVPASTTGPIGMGAAAFAAPMALREGLIEAYSNGHAASWEGVWEITKAALKGGAKGAVIGGATMGAGRAVGAALPATATTAGAVAKGTAVAGAEVATLTGTAAALEGQMPTWQDIMDNAILLGGMKGAVKVAGRLRSIYAETGKTPELVAADAARDPQLKAELTGQGAVDPFSYAEKTGIGIEIADRAEYISSHGKIYVPDLPPAEFQTKFGATREQVVSHELGHALLDKWGMTGEIKGPYYADLRAELRRVSKEFRGSVWDTARGHAQKSQELLADGLAVWMTNPAARSKMPLFEKLLGTRIDDLKGAPSKAAQVVPEAYRPLAVEERIKAAFDADQRPQMATELLRQANQPDAPITVDPVRYEYITDKATAEGVIRSVAEVYKESIETQRRGVVPTAESLAEGTRLIQEGKLDARTIGEGANSAEIAARALLTKGAAERARKLAAEMPENAKDWTPEMKLQMAGAMEQVGLFYGELAGAGAEAGRALQMLRQIKRNPEMLGDAESLVKLYERKGNFNDIAQMVKTLKDPEQMRKFAEGYQKATGMDMVVEAWKASILSGPLTAGANIIGNMLRFAADVPTAALTASLEAGRLAVKGDPMSMANYKAKALSPIYGVMLGAKDAVTIAGEVWRLKGEHLEKADIYKSAIPGKTGEVIRLPFRFLQVQDAFFRTFGERSKAYELAVERAGKEGLDPRTREFNEAVARYTEQPQLGLTEAQAQKVTAQIEAAGAEVIFAQQLGPRFEAASRAVAGSPVEFILPFRRTPVNLISWAAQYTPGLNFMSARWLADYKAGGELKSRAIARVAIGTGLAMTAFSMAQDGTLTGGGLFDKEQGRTKQGAGWQPYSIKVGDQYYSIERMEPIAKPLMLAADIHEMLTIAEDKDKAKIAPMAVLAFANATISTTYMSGIANAIKAVTDPTRYLQPFLEQYASSVVPKIVGQTVTLSDPYKREVDGVFEAIQSQLPFVREKLLPARDVWGEPKQNNKWFAVLPVNTSKEATEKVKTEAVRLQVAITDAPKSVTEKGPFKPSERGVELTNVERDVFRQVAGGAAMEFLRPIVNSPDWESMPDYAQAEMYRDVLKDTNMQAAWKALPPGDPRRDKMRQKLLARILQQNEDAAQRSAPAVEKVLRYNEKGQR